MNRYEAYLKHPAGNIITMEEALGIYSSLVECMEKCKTEDKMELWNNFIDSAYTYAHIRCRWETMTTEEKMDADSRRTSCHDGVIVSVNVLSRLAQSEGLDVSWREQLGDDRKRIGDFACFVSYITGISNR